MTLTLYLSLFFILTAGIYFACWIFGYEISHARKLGTAAAAVIAVAVMAWLPSPLRLGVLLKLPVPIVTLYVCLMDNTYDRYTVNKVFGVSLFIGAFGVILVYFLFR